MPWPIRRSDTGAAVAAHDVRNLLGIVSGHAELLLRDAGDARTREHLGEILAAARSAAAVAAGLLPRGRGRRADASAAPAPEGCTAAADAAERAASLFSGLLEPGVRLTTSCISTRAVAARPVELEQVLVNLLLNARDALPEGRGRIEIATADIEIDERTAAALRLRRAGPHVAVTVTDTGNGIPADVFDRIFEPGFTTKQPGRGTGLGLSAVGSTVERLGGSIAVETAPGAGTQVTLFLPAATDAALATDPSELVHSAG